MKNLLYLFFMLFLVGCSQSTNLSHTKSFKFSGNYGHVITKTKFPEYFDDYSRTQLTTFNKSFSNIAASYEEQNDKNDAKFTVYVYPAGSAHNGRLRDEYLNSLQSISNVADKEIRVTQNVLPFVKDNYRVNGLTAKIKLDSTTTSLTVFECGQWFLKYRISTNANSFNNLDSLRDKLLKEFCPIELVKNFPVVPKTSIHIAPAVLADSLLLGAIMGQALEESKWVYENIDSLEWSSGYPSMYLESHSNGLKYMIDWYDSNRTEFSPKYWNNEYILSIKKIIDRGFLNEFLMDEYTALLIYSDEIHFNFEEYEEWKPNHLPNFHLSKGYFYLMCPVPE